MKQSYIETEELFLSNNVLMECMCLEYLLTYSPASILRIVRAPNHKPGEGGIMPWVVCDCQNDLVLECL